MREFLESVNSETLSYQELHIILYGLPTRLSWATLPDGNIRYGNRAFKRLFGYSNDHFTTVEEWIEQAYIHEHHRRMARLRWENLWKTSASGISEIDGFEVEVRCANGDVRTVQHRGILLHDISIGIATFEDISERKRAELALHRLAFEDALTGLPNRRLLQNRWSDRVETADGSHGVSALLLVDLDWFKAVNDRYGHDAGDAVLIEVANRLRDCVRKEDLVCRLGGDEFVVLCHDIASYDQIAKLCWRIENSLSKPIEAAHRTVSVGASIGACLFPQDGDELPELLKRADEALYRVKLEGKGGWQWFAAPTAA